LPPASADVRITLKMGGESLDRQTVEGAWRRFEQLNRSYFNGELSLGELRFNSRFRRTLGTYSRDGGQGRIQLSRFYLRLFGWEELEKVLLHEMIHLRLDRPGHGSQFRGLEALIAERYGPLSPKPVPARAHRYIYVCERCGLEFGRWRRLMGDHFHRGCGGRLRLRRDNRRKRVSRWQRKRRG
jgi:predicted SprT family Zn-dependent metalloprotease